MIGLKKDYLQKRILFRECDSEQSGLSIIVAKWRHEPSEYADCEETRNKRDFWKIILVVSGRGWMLHNEKECGLDTGQVFLVHPDDLTSFRIQSESLEIFNVLFRSELFEKELAEFEERTGFLTLLGGGQRGASPLRVTATRELETIVHRMAREYHAEELNCSVMLKSLLMQLLVVISRLEESEKRRNRGRAVVELVHDEIEANFSGEIDFRALALRAGITPNHLSLVYRANTGKSITEALISRRISEALERLSEGRLPIRQVGRLCGFPDLSYFYRVFRRKTGMTPGEYRRTIGLH